MGLKTMNVMDGGNNYDPISDEAWDDPIAEALVALDAAGGLPSGRTLQEYMDGKIPNMKPAALIARYEAANPSQP